MRRMLTVAVAALAMAAGVVLSAPAAQATTTTACSLVTTQTDDTEVLILNSCPGFADHGGPYVFDIAKLLVLNLPPLGNGDGAVYSNVVESCTGYQYYGGTFEGLNCTRLS